MYNNCEHMEAQRPYREGVVLIVEEVVLLPECGGHPATAVNVMSALHSALFAIKLLF